MPHCNFAGIILDDNIVCFVNAQILTLMKKILREKYAIYYKNYM